MKLNYLQDNDYDQTFTVKVRKVYETDLLVDADTQYEAEEMIETMMESQSLDTYEDFEGVYDFGYEEVVAKEDPRTKLISKFAVYSWKVLKGDNDDFDIKDASFLMDKFKELLNEIDETAAKTKTIN